MSAREPAPGRSRDSRLTVGLFVALIAAIAPLLGVVRSGPWLLGVLVLTGALLAIGYGARRLRMPAVAVTLVELAVWGVFVTTIFLRDTAWLGIILTPDTFQRVPELIQLASTQILLGIAPLEVSPAVSFIIVASMGLLTIALDHVVMTARMPLLGSVALVAVWIIPAIAVPSGVNVFSFAFLAASVLYLIRAETRTREQAEPRGRGVGVATVAAGIGTVAVVASIISASILPAPVLGAGSGGALTAIDPTLELGDDLRQPLESTVLTYRTDASSLPYLRAATLSVFDGAEWHPDRLRSVVLGEEGGLGEIAVDPDVRVNEYRTNINITQLSSAWLPVSFPAVDVTGLDGVWRAVPFNRTVLTAQSNTRGQTYEVVTHVPKPTLEQIRAADASARQIRADVYLLPYNLPPIVAETAQTITANATNDYDRLIALQNWFRGPDFTYSLLSPVQDGFDGTGVDAIADFLTVREGYCVHFAAAFALMARTLEMPSRIVVGFLPGDYTGDGEDGQRIAEVTTSQLHAWPEVYFEGIGWVGFEPTKGLGSATSFYSESVATPYDGGQQVAGPTPTALPTGMPTGMATGRPDDNPSGAGGAGARAIDLRPFLTALLVALVLAVTPLCAAFVRTRLRYGRARTGSVAAAWRLVQDGAIDLGVAVPASESPRAFGARLVSVHGAPAAETRVLVAAIERASYAPDPVGAVGGRERGAEIADAALAVRAGMLASVLPAVRVRALLLPRSLVVRPGSAFADRATPV